MKAINRYSKLIFSIVVFIAGTLCFIYPKQVGNYFALIAGTLLILKGLVEWFARFKDRKYSPLFLPLMYILTGIIFIIGWKYIMHAILIVSAASLILLGFLKLASIKYYTIIKENPLYPIINAIVYLVVGILLLVFAILGLQNDSYSFLIGITIGIALYLLAIDTFIRFIRNKEGPLHRVEEDFYARRNSKNVIEVEIKENNIVEENNIEDNQNK